MSDTWSSEIQKFTCGVIFQNLICWRLNELKKVKRVGWILPSGRRLPHRRLKNSLSELQNPPWFRSADLGFGCFAGSDSNSGWFCEFLLKFMERCSWITLGLGVSITSWIQSGSGVLFLCGLLPILNSVGSWTLVKPDAMPSAFLGIIQTRQDEEKTSLKIGFLQARSRFDKG